MQIQAPVELNTIIKHYLFLETNKSKKTKYTLFANGNSGLVFSINKRPTLSGSNQNTPRTFVFGQVSNHLNLELEEGTKILVVVFQPYGLHILTKIPNNEIKDDIIEAESIFGEHIKILEEMLLHSSDRGKLIDRVNQHFTGYFLKKKRTIDLIIPEIVNKIITTQGNLSIQDIKEEFAIHERKLQRLFSEQVGLSPKKFIQIARLHAFIGHLKSRSRNEHITDSVYKTGYYDQSHLIRNFKSITGMTPSQYMYSSTLAVNLVEIF